jgi:hypothetical protein
MCRTHTEEEAAVRLSLLLPACSSTKRHTIPFNVLYLSSQFLQSGGSIGHDVYSTATQQPILQSLVLLSSTFASSRAADMVLSGFEDLGDAECKSLKQMYTQDA